MKTYARSRVQFKICLTFVYSQILAVGPKIGTSSTMLLQNADDTLTPGNNQKWIFNADGTIKSLDGWTLTIYQSTDGQETQLIGNSGVTTPTDLQIFKAIPYYSG